MKNISLLSIVIALVLSQPLLAEADGLEHNNFYEEPVAMKIIGAIFRETISVADSGGIGGNINYKPDSLYDLNTGYEVSIGYLGLYYRECFYSFLIWDKRGGPAGREGKAFFFYNWFGAELFYFSENNYYLYYGDHRQELEDKYEYYNEPEINTKKYGLHIYLIPFTNFSYAASFKQSMRQQESAGSLIFRISPYKMTLKSNWGIIPENFRHFYDTDGVVDNISMNNLAASVGYAYNLTSKGFYLLGYANIGIELENIRFNTEVGDKEIRKNVPFYMYGITAGYNERDSILTFNFERELKTVKLEKAELKFRTNVYQIAIGIRI